MGAYAAELCPRYHRAIEIIGRRWSGAILRVMLDGATRFNEIRNAIAELSDRMLSERLKELEAEGLVRREVRASTPVSIEYHLTPMGEALRPVLASVGEWANDWLPTPAAESGG